jgi:ABC-type transport system involved in multi-copper enzyme maturation permease subunit
MAVYEHSYKPYTGPATPNWSRLMVIPRHMFGAIFQSKLFTGFYAFCFGCPLVMAVLVYLKHNLNALKILNLNAADVLQINNSFFMAYCSFQFTMAFLLTVIIGPILISRDLTNNALPLYLSRPFSRTEYVLGKASVLFILISAITWAPGLALFIFQSCLEGWSWLTGNLWISLAIVVASLVWITILTLLAMSLSAWVKWRIGASAIMFGVFIMPSAVATFINVLFRTGWGSLISISQVLSDVTRGLFREPAVRVFNFDPAPLAADWAVLIVTAAVCLWVLSLKIKAYEISR